MVNPIINTQRQMLRPDNVTGGVEGELYMWLWPHQLRAALEAGCVVHKDGNLVLNVEGEPRAIICAMTKIPVTP